MAVDGLILHQEIKTLQNITPAKINRITQPSDNEILFSMRANYTNQQLLMSVHSQYNRIHLTQQTYTNPPVPSAFTMLLRKHLENGIITSIQQGGLDRYVKITISKNNEISDRQDYYLYLELMGKYANLILCSSTNKILDALKRIPPYENTKRIIFAGATYTPNPKPQRLNPFENIQLDFNQSLMEQFDGFSPLLAKEVQFRLTKNQQFADIINLIAKSDNLYYYPQEKVFHVIELSHLSNSNLIYNINQGFDLIYQTDQERIRIEQLTGSLFKFVRNEHKKLLNKLPKLQDSLSIAKECDQWRNCGDLIFSNLSSIKKGMTEITLWNYETNAMSLIPLEAKLNAKQNGQKYYHRYHKGKNGQKFIQIQIDKCQQEILYFAVLLEQLEIADFSSAKEIQEELVSKKYLRLKLKKPKKVAKLAYQTLSINDKSVYYGKNSSQNEYVTFKLGHKKDTWFHAKDYHGAHVVIECDQPDETEIRFCANLAAYFSKGRYSSSVPVNYTQISNIKKIPNSPIGLVSISSYKTIFIDPKKPD